MNIVKGYKVFNPDWTCRGKRYTCPGKFEENNELDVCKSGMHFCKKAADCFDYYKFDPENKVAEVAAYGEVQERGDKCCTDKLEIVREIPWTELLEIVNIGKNCTGFKNTGNRNSGGWNTGDHNTGGWNTGDWNTGDMNSGDHNTGNRNTGDHNTGNRNTGDMNSGNRNTGDHNTGNRNSGGWNTGDHNTGNRNTGDWNTGDMNSGDGNSGDWNNTNFSNGCFNTIEPKIYLFNKISDWTFRDWLNSEARIIMSEMPSAFLRWTNISDMDDKEKEEHPESQTTGGYLKLIDNTNRVQSWWDNLSADDKSTVMAIPNFDRDIFHEITGIDIDQSESGE